MAYVSEDHCSECNEITVHANGKCVSCAAKKEKAKDERWLAMPIANQVFDLYQRVKQLEAQKAKY